MPETLAILIDQNLVQLARARSGEAGPEIVKLHYHQIPDGADPMAEAATLLQAHKGGATRTAVMLAWRHYSIREKWLQLTSEADIRSVLKYELADDLAADPQTLVMPFQIVEEQIGRAHV